MGKHINEGKVLEIVSDKGFEKKNLLSQILRMVKLNLQNLVELKKVWSF